MKMKMMSLIAAVTLLTMNAKAQTSKLNPGGFYIKGGYNAANISKSNDGSVDDTKTLSTFQAGVVVDLPLADVFSIQTGLLLNGKGAKSNSYLDNSNTSDNYVKAKFNPLYLEIPANFVVKFPLGDKMRLFVGAGPYIAMGVGGKSKLETSFAGVKSSSSESIKFNNNDPTTGEQEGASFDRLKRFDFGLNGLAGLEIDRFLVGLNYGVGLTKINSTQTNNSSNDKNKYRTLSLSVGVRI